MAYRTALAAILIGALASMAHAQAIGARRVQPNLQSNIERPIRYQPVDGDFVIENGAEFFNRPLYGGNTAFRVDAGDKPEFSLYLPGRGGNLRLGVGAGGRAKWLIEAQSVIAKYRPGGMVYEIRDPLLGSQGALQIDAYALSATKGLIVRIQTRDTPADLELIWAFGGTNGKRGARDGDIGTEKVPISEYFQLSPEFCRGNAFELAAGSFTMRSAPAMICGRVTGDAKLQIADSRQWDDPQKLLDSTGKQPVDLPVVVGQTRLPVGQAIYVSLQMLTSGVAADLPTYREVTAGQTPEAALVSRNLPPFTAADLSAVFGDAEAEKKALRQRVTVDTPDAYLNAAVGALNVAADAVWDEPQHGIMHGAIAWRTRLLGWRGPYLLDDLGWHDRAAENFSYWAKRQNVDPIPPTLPPADEVSNLSRSETALHTNGDISNSHYDMNLVHIDAVFRHILWTGDMDFARTEWPVIQRHLAWEQRSFRRPFGPDKLPLYEAYAAIWASDDLEYDGGGAAHSTAYNYYHNMMAARVARLIGKDPTPYEKEAGLIAKAMRQYLWLPDSGSFAEFRDYLGMQLPHPAAGLWTFYHTIDSEVPTSFEAWQMTRELDTQMPHMPVRGPGVPSENAPYVLPETDWMPYLWSVNNVCMNEDAHTALGYWQAGRGDEAYRLLIGSVLASMYMGISPGNVGTMDLYDVYRRESQRDFGDGSGCLSRAVVEGLFGIRPDAMDGQLRLAPGFPDQWDHAAIHHPDVDFAWHRDGQIDTFAIDSRFPRPMALRLEWPAYRDDIVAVTVDGKPAQWKALDDAVGVPRIAIEAPSANHWDVIITWTGNAPTTPPQTISAQLGQPVHVVLAGAKTADPGVSDPQHTLSPVSLTQGDAVSFEAKAIGAPGDHTVFVRIKQGALAWWLPLDITIQPGTTGAPAPLDWAKAADPAEKFQTVDLSNFYNDRVTQIFKHEYRSPRSPGVSLAIPKQGIGAWAGDVKATARIDDAGLRAQAASHGGKIIMPNGVPFATPGPGNSPNIIFTSQFDNFPHEVAVPLNGTARRVMLLMAGSTNPMQSRFDNGEVVVTYADGSASRLGLRNPDNWWPIEQDYFIDDYQFRRPGPIPPRIDLLTGQIRLLDPVTFEGKGGVIPGGAATALELALDPQKPLRSLTVRTLGNEVVVGLMACTLER
jgi:hypothetical protein